MSKTIIRKTNNFLSAKDQYLAIIVSCLPKKLNSKKEPIYAQVCKKYPYANIYEKEKKRVAGDFKIVGNGTTQRYIILIYSQFYEGKSDFPNDNKNKRLQWFIEALDQISEIGNMKNICFPSYIARDGGGAWDQYYTAISDFAKTLQLKIPIEVAIYENPYGTEKSIENQISLLNCVNLMDMVELKHIAYTEKTIEITVEEPSLSKKESLTQGVKRTKLKLQLEEIEKPDPMFDLISSEGAEPDQQENHLPNYPNTKLNSDWTIPLSKLVNEENVIHPSWQIIFGRQEISELLERVDRKLLIEIKKYGDQVRFLPAYDNIFNAFRLCSWDDLRIVIIGQDPYFSKLNEAMGLSFSVPKTTKIPPSLQNIFKEINNDYEDYEIPKHGDLTEWAEQGVLLLNASLTVKHKQKESHMDVWKSFTDRIIQLISQVKEHPVIFILWGRYAQSKSKLIDWKRHMILKGTHPSPLSANRGGFFNNEYFSKANDKLLELDLDPIDWQT